ncbi:hypothetical protein ACLOJK_005859 [Asimina triloba]
MTTFPKANDTIIVSSSKKKRSREEEERRRNIEIPKWRESLIQMGCVSSKQARNDLKQEALFGKGNYSNHVVYLTSTTYGALQLEAEIPIRDLKKSPLHLLRKKAPEQEPEIINAWELMQDLEEEISKKPISPLAKTVLKTHVFLHTVAEADGKKQIPSPNRQKRFEGKENSRQHEWGLGGGGRLDFDEKQVFRPFSSLENVRIAAESSELQSKNAPTDLKIQRSDTGFSMSRRPLFDPDLVASFERELSEEGEQIKKMVSPAPKSRKTQEPGAILESFRKRCPPGGGENAVVLYTTTLRGIRKTFEDCNSVRAVIESYGVQTMERDVSMDSGFREELRVLMGQKEVRVPVVFVKGRLIGGAEEVMKLEEDGKLGSLLKGIPRAMAPCDGCGGMRFVMCMDCNGSCKVLGEDQKKMVRCAECNENGLIRCPICC